MGTWARASDQTVRAQARYSHRSRSGFPSGFWLLMQLMRISDILALLFYVPLCFSLGIRARSVHGFIHWYHSTDAKVRARCWNWLLKCHFGVTDYTYFLESAAHHASYVLHFLPTIEKRFIAGSTYIKNQLNQNSIFLSSPDDRKNKSEV